MIYNFYKIWGDQKPCPICKAQIRNYDVDEDLITQALSYNNTDPKYAVGNPLKDDGNTVTRKK